MIPEKPKEEEETEEPDISTSGREYDSIYYFGGEENDSVA